MGTTTLGRVASWLSTELAKSNIDRSIAWRDIATREASKRPNADTRRAWAWLEREFPKMTGSEIIMILKKRHRL